MAADQRARLREAMLELVDERGYEGVRVRDLVGRATVSTRSFYQHFAGAEGCFSYTYASLMRASLRHAEAAKGRNGDWREDVRAALHTVLEELAGHPAAARLVLSEAYAPGLAMQPVMRREVAGFEQLLAARLASAPVRHGPPRHLLMGMASGVTRAARARVEAGAGIEVAELEPQLGAWLLGLAEAGAYAATAIPEQPGGQPAAAGPVAERFGAVGDERGRILAATAKLVLGGGYGCLTAPGIRAAAGASRRCFDAHFADVGDCFLAAVAAVAAAGGRRAAPLLAGSGEWERRVERTVAALCVDAAREPALARLVFVELLGAGSRGLRRREEMIGAAAAHLRGAAPAARRPMPLAAEAAVAAAWQIAQVEVAAGRAARLPALAPALARLLAG